MAVFSLSLFVAIVSIVFSALLVKKVTAALAPSPKATVSLTRSPNIVRQTVAHALDVAAAFPSSILTLVAFAPYFPPGETATSLVVIIAVSLTLFFVVFANPKYASSYFRANNWKAKKFDPRRIGGSSQSWV